MFLAASPFSLLVCFTALAWVVLWVVLSVTAFISAPPGGRTGRNQEAEDRLLTHPDRVSVGRPGP